VLARYAFGSKPAGSCSEAGGLAEALQPLGGAAVVVSTASGGKALAQAVKGLAPHGMLLTLGATSDPLASFPPAN
jgi:NADPH:quinone reductase-like Zn-dependent oxidoreductase